MNFLEQLTSEWYEFRGYFVRRNVLVGRRAAGGYECELDVVGFHPGEKRLVHIEASMDAHTWARREERFSRKFEAGRRYIPSLFAGLDLPTEIEQIALLGYGSNANRKMLAGATLMVVGDLIAEIVGEIQSKRVAKAAIPEDKPILRTLQYVCECRNRVLPLLR